MKSKIYTSETLSFPHDFSGNLRKNNFFLTAIFFCLFTFAFSHLHAQEVKKHNEKSPQASKVDNPNQTQAVEGDVIFSNGTNQLLRITDEGGTSGAIQFTDGDPTTKTNKLYRKGDSLYFGNINLCKSGIGAVKIDDLSDAISGDNNVYIGKYSGINNTIGAANTAVGLFSQYSNTTGSNNTSMGWNSLKYNTTGGFNSAFGQSALSSNTIGLSNSSIGSNSLSRNTTGSNNVGLGAASNYYNETGSNNTIIGVTAGHGAGLHNKSGNVFLGFQAGYHEIGDNKLYINNDSSAFPLIWGDFTDGSELVKINGDFHVTGNITSDGTSVIASAINDLTDAKTDATSVFLGEGTGNLDDGSINQNTAIGIAALNVNSSGAYNTSLGYNSLNKNQTGNNNIGIGVENMFSNISGHDNISVGNSSLFSNTAGHSNVSVGSSSLYTTQGNQNTAVGFESARNNSVDGSTAIGHKAMYSNTTGSGNTATGYNALQLNTTGIGNTANGYEALTSLPLGNFNTAIGYRTLYTGSFVANNTAVGYQALNQSNGEQNTAVGSKALETNNGSNNSAFGNSSLLSITGSYNSAFGSLACNVISGDSNSAIGYRAAALFSGNQNIAFGSYSLESGGGNYNIGVGNSSGDNVNGSKNIFIGHEAGYHGTSSYTQSGSIFIGYQAGKNELTNNKLYIENSNSDSPLIWGNFNTDRVVINGNGTNGNPSYNFYVNGDAGGNTAWNNLSDERLKKNISTISNALEKVQNLRGVNYEWKNPEKYSEGLQMGFIAQEANEIIPEVVDDTGEYYSMQYAPITALLVEAMKEQQNFIDEIKKQNSELINQNAEFRSENFELKKDIEQIKNVLNEVVERKNELKFTSN